MSPAQSREFEQWLFANQARLSRQNIRARLKEMQLERAFSMQHDHLMREIEADVVRAQRLGVTGTPTVIVNGARLDNPAAAERLERLIAFETVRGR